MVRSACGNNDHPDPHMFLLIFRLLSLYSLVKAAGSNVSSDELFDTLLNPDSDVVVSSRDANKARWENIRTTMVNMVSEGEPDELLNMTEDDRLLEFLSGYVAGKAIKFKKCHACAVTILANNSLVTDSSQSAPSLIDLRNFYGVLHYPSKSLFLIISTLEKCIRDETNEENIGPDTFFNITEQLESVNLPAHVGCDEHFQDIMSYIIHFYTILRMQFAVKAADVAKINKTAAGFRKMGKLVQGKTEEEKEVRKEEKEAKKREAEEEKRMVKVMVEEEKRAKKQKADEEKKVRKALVEEERKVKKCKAEEEKKVRKGMMEKKKVKRKS